MRNNTDKTISFKFKEQAIFSSTIGKEQNINSLYLYPANKDSSFINDLFVDERKMHSFPSIEESNKLMKIKIKEQKSVYIRFEIINYTTMKKIFNQLKSNTTELFASLIYISNYDSIKKTFQYNAIKSDKILFYIERCKGTF